MGNSDTPEEVDVDAWRKQERTRLIEARKALPEADYDQRNEKIADFLLKGFARFAGTPVGFCWPFGNEPEPRFVVRQWREAGSRTALPVVVKARQPLVFREWWPGAPVEKGVYDIPYPVDTEELAPAAALVPANGIDDEGYRLGYGGAFFDRTLAALETKPICVALGYDLSRIPTIYPQPHDIPFDFAVTESGILARIDGALRPVSAEQADAHVRALQEERRITGEPSSSA